MRSFVRALGALSLAISAVALSATSARAGVVFTSDFNDSQGFTLNISTTNSYATGFTTGASASFLDLKSVKLSLKTSSTSSLPVVSIFSNTVTGVGNVPGTLLATLTGPGPITNTLAAQDFLFTGNLSLSATTNYWVVLSTTNASSRYQWEVSGAPPTEANLSGYAALGGRRRQTGAWSNNTFAEVGMVEIEAVPEPSTIILAGIGMAGAVVVDTKRRQRRRRMMVEAAAETETL